jgi:predicted O-methyltransferase YrrM
MKSSYTKHNFDLVFKTICAITNPKKIVEFGILDGYSLKAFIDSSKSDCIIEAYDLFDEFPYNAADWDVINEKYSSDNVHICKADFYKGVELFSDNSIDIMHIDIANDGDVYEFAIENYMKKISDGGVMVFEGGSTERDEYDWMDKYNKRKISPYVETIKNKYEVTVIENFPSLTIIKKK